jgi:sialate O-acetylesterase
MLRQLKIPISWSETPEADLEGGTWTKADPQHAGAFSGVGYHFARELRESQKVPIAIVNTSWGGSAIETWLSAGAQKLGENGAARALAVEKARLDSMRAVLRARIGEVPERDPGLVNGRAPWADPALDDASWTTIKVPGYWEGQGFEGLDGVAWYRTRFTLRAEEAAKGATLLMGPIDDDDISWVNGVEIGRTNGYNVPRRYTIPASALRAGTNVLAVRVADGSGGGGIASSATTDRDVRLEMDGTTKALAGQWKFRVGELAFRMDGQRLNKVPSITYNRMIHPILRMPIAGAIWYQGESNANSDEQARAYRGQLETLVTSWRREWAGNARAKDANRRDFPFLWVQLPNFGQAEREPSATGGSWAIIREAMTQAAKLPNTGQAITIDVGNPADIHPRDKTTVGHRLALVARQVAYGEEVHAFGPTYRSFTVQGDRVVIDFDHAHHGLVARGSADGTLRGFAIAGADRRWVWADARIEGNRVVVRSDLVKNPVAVRYAWSGNPEGVNFFDREGLPAAPFRTDAW